MASDYNVKQHDIREVEYNVYEDPMFKTTFTQLSVSDIKDGKGKIHTYDGEDANFVYDILVGKFDAGKRISELNRVITDKNDTIKNLEFYISKLEGDLKTERQKYSEATKLNDDLHKDLAQWKQMYEDVYNVYNHEVDIQRENEELMKERDGLKKDVDDQRSVIARLENVNREIRIQRDGYKKELAEEEFIRTGFEKKCDEFGRENKKLDEIVENQANTIRELTEKNDLQETTIHKLETVISKKSNRIALLEHMNDGLQKRNEGLCKQVETQEVNLKVIIEENRSFREKNDSLKMRLNELAGKTYCSEDVYTARIAYLEKEVEKQKYDNESLKETLKMAWKSNTENTEKITRLEHDRRIMAERNDELRKKLDDECMSRNVKNLEKRLSEETARNSRLVTEKDTLGLQIVERNREIEELKTKLKNAQESNGKIWNMYAEQLAKNKERQTVQSNAVCIENARLLRENYELTEENRDLKRKCDNFENAEPAYVQISGFRSGSLVLKLMGENHKLRKERDNALEALSEKDCALAEARAELMKRRPCCGCPFKS